MPPALTIHLPSSPHEPHVWLACEKDDRPALANVEVSRLGDHSVRMVGANGFMLAIGAYKAAGDKAVVPQFDPFMIPGDYLFHAARRHGRDEGNLLRVNFDAAAVRCLRADGYTVEAAIPTSETGAGTFPDWRNLCHLPDYVGPARMPAITFDTRLATTLTKALGSLGITYIASKKGGRSPLLALGTNVVLDEDMEGAAAFGILMPMFSAGYGKKQQESVRRLHG